MEFLVKKENGSFEKRFRCSSCRQGNYSAQEVQMGALEVRGSGTSVQHLCKQCDRTIMNAITSDKVGKVETPLFRK